MKKSITHLNKVITGHNGDLMVLPHLYHANLIVLNLNFGIEETLRPTILHWVRGLVQVVLLRLSLWQLILQRVAARKDRKPHLSFGNLVLVRVSNLWVCALVGETLPSHLRCLRGLAATLVNNIPAGTITTTAAAATGIPPHQLLLFQVFLCPSLQKMSLIQLLLLYFRRREGCC